MKKFLYLAQRAIFILISLALQLGLIVIATLSLDQYSYLLYVVMYIVSIMAIINLSFKNTYAEVKTPWMILFILLPIFAIFFYMTYGKRSLTKKESLIQDKIAENFNNAMSDVKAIEDYEIAEDVKVQSTYLANISHSPAYVNTAVKYYPLGDDMYPDMLLELEKAEKYIFLEYYIIEDGKFWSSIEEILVRKAAAGVDVRVMYDDWGCALKLSPDFEKKLSSKNIKVKPFNVFKHLFNSKFNNRDHRKICVIDGNVGFTGGINLADEYITAVEVFGHWKDTAVRLTGDAVYSLTTMFLSMWSARISKVEDFTSYKPSIKCETDGLVQPFGDSPDDGDSVGETAYMNMIYKAKKYIYITTPYLIISREVMVALIAAAKSGIDVRIITPGIPDKKFILFLTQSYYEELLLSGVKIYEYNGFIHSKLFVSDDEVSIIGTINLDYRSLSLNYECAVFLYKCSAIKNIIADFNKTKDESKEVLIENAMKKGNLKFFKKVYLAILRTFAPLL